MENREKFTGKARIYEKYRPDYPEAAYEFITKDLGLPDNAVIADIGAGTGLFSFPLIKKGYRVYCVEPNSDMKLVLDEKAGGFENYHGINATAENTTLPDNSVDLVTVAQAFHWFDRQAFKKECKRILKPDGKAVFLWNVKDEEWELTKEINKLNKKFCPNFKGFSGGTNPADVEQFNDFFKDGCKMKIFANDIFDENPESFVGRCLSSSYALKEGDENYVEYMAALYALFSKYADDMRTVIKNQTTLYWGEV